MVCLVYLFSHPAVTSTQQRRRTAKVSKASKQRWQHTSTTKSKRKPWRETKWVRERETGRGETLRRKGPRKCRSTEKRQTKQGQRGTVRTGVQGKTRKRKKEIVTRIRHPKRTDTHTRKGKDAGASAPTQVQTRGRKRSRLRERRRRRKGQRKGSGKMKEK